MYEWKPGVYLVDDADVVYPTGPKQKSGGGAMLRLSVPSPCAECPTNSEGLVAGYSGLVDYSSSNVLWLEIIGATNGTASLVIHRPTPPTGDGYDLIYTTNLAPVVTWTWLMEVPPSVSGVTLSTTNFPVRFFQLKKIPDLDGDGLRDSWEWGGSVPGSVVLDDDRDNDGIPDSIEASSGSLTNDPASRPPPSLYVKAGATGGDGSFDLPLPDIQTAINLATNYSVILVKAGTYSGVSNRNLNFGGPAVTEPALLTSAAS